MHDPTPHLGATGASKIQLRIWDSDVVRRFGNSPLAVLAGTLTLIFFAAAAFAPWITPHDPSDLKALALRDSLLPPIWYAEGEARYLLGTDIQGRDVFASLLYGMRLSLLVGWASVLFSVLVGVTLGLVAGSCGRLVDALIMRVADTQLSFPAILIALLVDGISRVIIETRVSDRVGMFVVVFAIGITGWVTYARTVRASVLVEMRKEYVAAACLIGRHPLAILLDHVAPKMVGPVLVLANLQVGKAIVAEATLSFLGIGIPSTQPSLGTQIRLGNDYLLSGEWWVLVFPGALLVVMVLSFNALGDRMREVLNPRVL